MNICVYGASSRTIDEKYIKAGEKLGREMAKRGMGLVFGGGANGMMGAVARGVSEKNGYVLGVAPTFFQVDGTLFNKCNEFIYTDTMRQRKQTMEERSDAFIMTPGGIGTFEEFFEILTLKQLNRHNKPICVFNVNGYFDSMEEMMKKAEKETFINNACFKLYKFFTEIYEMLSYIENYNEEVIEIVKLKNI